MGFSTFSTGVSAPFKRGQMAPLARIWQTGGKENTMSTITFDTLKFVKQLEASGVPPGQAEAFVLAQQQILSDVLDSTLATKADLLATKNELKLDIAGLRGEMANVKWILGAVLAVAIANFAKQFF
jgi:hypothetical protein